LGKAWFLRDKYLNIHKQLSTAYFLRFEVQAAANMKMAVFWVVALYGLVEIYRRLGGVCCLHHRPDDGGSKNL
jgi:hypothetical protein